GDNISADAGRYFDKVYCSHPSCKFCPIHDILLDRFTDRHLWRRQIRRRRVEMASRQSENDPTHDGQSDSIGAANAAQTGRSAGNQGHFVLEYTHGFVSLSSSIYCYDYSNNLKEIWIKRSCSLVTLWPGPRSAPPG